MSNHTIMNLMLYAYQDSWYWVTWPSIVEHTTLPTSELFTWTINSNWMLTKYKLVKVRSCVNIIPLYKSTFSNLLNQAHVATGMHLVFWNCFCSRVGMWVSVCPPPRALITSGVIRRDIGRVWLVKPILQLLSLLPLIN